MSVMSFTDSGGVGISVL